MEYLIFGLLLFIVIRTIRKDRSDGRDLLGGGAARDGDVKVQRK